MISVRLEKRKLHQSFLEIEKLRKTFLKECLVILLLIIGN